jgi:hypothetical protein
MKYAILLSLSLVTLGLAAPAAAESGTYECTTTAGLGNPAVSGAVDLTDEAGVALGGCNLVTLSEESTVDSVDPADGCSISVDIDGDGVGDEAPTAGAIYGADASFTAFCDLGTTEATSSISFV